MTVSVPKSILFWLLFVCTGTAGDNQWRLALESGYFHGGHRLDSKDVRWMSVGWFHWRSQFNGDRQSLTVQFRWRPEIYSPAHGTYSFHETVGLLYGRRAKAASLQFAVDLRRSDYRTDSASILTYAVLARMTSAVVLSPEWSMEAGVMPSLVRIETPAATDILSLGVHARLVHHRQRSRRWYAGLQEEFFQAKNQDQLLVDHNRGHRYGLDVGVDFQKPLVLSLNYKLLRRTSQLTTPAWDHEFRFLAGKNLSDDWSLYVMADYYVRPIHTKLGLSSSLLYTGADQEQRISGKLAYHLSRRADLFARLFYERTELSTAQVIWSGTRFALGVEWRAE